VRNESFLRSFGTSFPLCTHVVTRLALIEYYKYVMDFWVEGVVE
jgi:hypothetical protein